MKKITMLSLVALTIASCKSTPKDEPIDTAPVKAPISTAPTTQKGVIEITSVEQFQQIIAQKDRLMVFDLYADWCKPCKMLAPILTDVSGTHAKQADFYKINTEKLPSLAKAFQVQGIPYVVFFKDGGIANAYTGLYPKEAYEQSVEILAQPLSDTAQGTLVEGNRQITISNELSSGNITTYRGDKVELTVSATGKPFTVRSQELGIDGSSDGKEDLKFTFKVKELGFYPLAITNESGRDDRLWVGVIQFGAAESSYKEVDAKQFAAEIEKENTVLLDVRSKSEYDDGHIKGATLIPVNELERRIGELESSKDKTILLYCRSGNRSTVASNILKSSGFNSLVNLRPGIKAWVRADLPVEK